MRNRLLSLVALTLAMAVSARAQSISGPPDGGNQHASVSQYLGPVKVTIDYHSPKVHSPANGEDRRGKIWGQLVPWGFAPGLGYGNCKQCPWRGGANENTTFTVSHDVKIEGQPLPAGTYALFFAPQQDEWTVIFSKNAGSWGSFWYDPSEDALRVKVKPAKSEYHEYLTYEFPERQLDKTVATLKWEDLQVPITITADSIHLYMAQIKQEMRNDKGFDWKNYVAAARFALQNKIDLPEALAWAETAAQPTWPGQESYATLSTLAEAQEANGKAAEAKATWEKALNHPTASAIEVHAYARRLLTQGKKDEAFALWQRNAKMHGDAWPVNVGLARGYSAVGKYKDALKYAKLAYAQAPDEPNKAVLKSGIEKLEKGQDMNQ
jgi:tetratricopeptide (TPR) repeat protein